METAIKQNYQHFAWSESGGGSARGGSPNGAEI